MTTEHAQPLASSSVPASVPSADADYASKLKQAVESILAGPSAASSVTVSASGPFHQPSLTANLGPAPTLPERRKRGRPRKRPEDLAVNKKKLKRASKKSSEDPAEAAFLPRRTSAPVKRRRSVPAVDSSASDSDIIPATDDEEQNVTLLAARSSSTVSAKPGKRQRPSYAGLFAPVVDERISSSASPPSQAPPDFALIAETIPSSDDIDELDLIDEPVRVTISPDSYRGCYAEPPRAFSLTGFSDSDQARLKTSSRETQSGAVGQVGGALPRGRPRAAEAGPYT